MIFYDKSEKQLFHSPAYGTYDYSQKKDGPATIFLKAIKKNHFPNGYYYNPDYHPPEDNHFLFFARATTYGISHDHEKESDIEYPERIAYWRNNEGFDEYEDSVISIGNAVGEYGGTYNIYNPKYNKYITMHFMQLNTISSKGNK